MNKNLEKWEKTGLLEGLDEQEARKIAQILGNSASVFLLYYKEIPNDLATRSMFPIIRRVMSQLFVKFGHDKFFVPTLPAFLYPEPVDDSSLSYKPYVVASKDLPSFPTLQELNDVVAYNQIDAECEIVANYSEKVVETISRMVESHDGPFAIYMFIFSGDVCSFRYQNLDSI